MVREREREGEWKPLMRPCVIRELSRPNEALTYLSYQPPRLSPPVRLPPEPPTTATNTGKAKAVSLLSLPSLSLLSLLRRRIRLSSSRSPCSPSSWSFLHETETMLFLSFLDFFSPPSKRRSRFTVELGIERREEEEDQPPPPTPLQDGGE